MRTEKERRKAKFILVGEILFNIAVIALIFGIIWFVYYRYNIDVFLYKKGTAMLIFVYALLFEILTNIYKGHKVGYLRISELIYSQALAISIDNAFVWVQICLIDRKVVAIHPIVILTIIDFIFIIAWSIIVTRRFRKRNKVRKLLVVCDDRLPKGIVEKMNWYAHKFKINEQVSTSEGMETILKKVNENEGIVLSEMDTNIKEQLIQLGFEKGIPVFIMPTVAELVIKNSNVLSMCDMPVLITNKGDISLVDEFIKRAFDIVVSATATLLLSPIMLITALCIKLYDGGPVLYKQKRLTINGREFMVYKFRSMIMDAEKDGVARLAKQGDDRITPVGKFIRKVRIDELPQLLNILEGSMSIVGPRPERPEIARVYEQSVPEFAYRLKVKAGLTGYAQVVGRYNTDPYDKLMWDLMYIQNYSFLLDLRIMLMTVKILFIPESTQGVTNGSVTASSERSERKESV